LNPIVYGFSNLVSISTNLVRRISEAGRGAPTDTNRSEHPSTRNRPMAAGKSRSKSKAARPTTVTAYLASLTPEKRAVIEEARAFVRRHIPKGYAEFMNWGVINWGIPLEEFSNTHNGQPLCYVGLGAQKNYNSLYLMGTHDSANGQYTSPFSQKLLVDAFKKAGKRLDMGKCCLHFKVLDDLELTSVATVIAMSTPTEYIAYYKCVKGLA
jgi:uncharacterized protein DUF1801